MGAKQVNLVGIKFNRLHVIELFGTRKYGKNNKRIWKCRCDCGKIVYQNTGALTTGNSKSCGCLHNELSSENGKKSRHKVAKEDAGYKSLYSSYKCNAKNRKLQFDVTFEHFMNLLKDNCFYCNSEPSNIYFKSYYNTPYNGVDRINNELGYTNDNIVSCCKICNISKNNYSTEVFFDWIQRISRNYKKLKINMKEKLKKDING
jgi:hypothetical protein